MRIITTISLVLGLLLAPPSMAKELVVGFVDVPTLIERSPQSVEAGKRLEEEFAPRQAKLTEKRGELSRNAQ